MWKNQKENEKKIFCAQKLKVIFHNFSFSSTHFCFHSIHSGKMGYFHFIYFNCFSFIIFFTLKMTLTSMSVCLFVKH